MLSDSVSSQIQLWCVVPVFNNEATVYTVAMKCRDYVSHVVVVDDGSTDCDVAGLFVDTDITVLTHERNQGKGVAITTAARFVYKEGGTHIVTIDADAQHYPADIAQCLSLLEKDPESLIIGVRKFDDVNITKRSRVGRMVANFWMRIETGLVLNDCQSGFRVYPVALLLACEVHSKHYDFETEILVRLVWGGVRVQEIVIDVWYPKPEDRISHYRPYMDTFRISHMHACLVFRRINPLPHKKIVQVRSDNFDFNILKHPILLVKMLLKENVSPLGLAASAGVGIVLAVLPLIGLHTLAIVYVTARLHLNKVMAVSIQHICMPPLVPLLCIEVGYFIRNGMWLTELSRDVILGNLTSRLYEWFLGSLIIAPLLALVVGYVVYCIAVKYQRAREVSCGE